MPLQDLGRVKFHPDLDFMTADELELFQALRETGAITVYRTATCEECGIEIIKGKKYCSRTCKNKKEEGEEDA